MVNKWDIEKWMDEQIECNERMSRFLTVNEDGDKIRNLSVRKYEIQITAEAVRYIAETCRLELAVIHRSGGIDPYEIFILYNGMKFFGLESEDEYNERGAVV